MRVQSAFKHRQKVFHKKRIQITVQNCWCDFSIEVLRHNVSCDYLTMLGNVLFEVFSVSVEWFNKPKTLLYIRFFCISTCLKHVTSFFVFF